MARGRPSDYTDAKADAICEAMLTTDENGKPFGLRKILSAEGMPDPVTMFRWLREREYFRNQYAQAREAQADLYAEYRMGLVEELPTVEIPTKFGSYVATDGAGVQRNRLRFDAANTHAKQLAPKKYGDKIQHSGDAEAPLEVVIRRVGGKIE